MVDQPEKKKKTERFAVRPPNRMRASERMRLQALAAVLVATVLLALWMVSSKSNCLCFRSFAHSTCFFFYKSSSGPADPDPSAQTGEEVGIFVAHFCLD